MNPMCVFYALGFCDGCEPGECDDDEGEEEPYPPILTTLDGDDIPE